MPINRKYRINSLTVEMTNVTGTAGMILTPALMTELKNSPALWSAVESLLPHIGAALDFDEFVEIASYNDNPRKAINETYTPAELGKLLDNPLLSTAAKDAIYAHLETHIAPPRGAPDPAGYVYLLQADLPGHPCKIGKSKNVPDRIKLFSIRLPFDFELLHTLAADDHHAAERALHERYADKRGHGEWFNLSEADIADILALDGYQNGEWTTNDLHHKPSLHAQKQAHKQNNRTHPQMDR